MSHDLYASEYAFKQKKVSLGGSQGKHNGGSGAGKIENCKQNKTTLFEKNQKTLYKNFVVYISVTV